MLINTLDELIKYISDDNNPYSEIKFSNDFNYKEMIDYLSKHKDDYTYGLYLAYCYFYGIGIEENKEESFKLFKSFAEQGYARAQYNVGYCYYSGNGIEKDTKEAIKWYELAASQGHTSAQFNLANLYFFGVGVEKNKEEAFKWCKLAAEQGHAEAQFSLGTFYDFGEKIEKNKEEAFKWYRKSAEQGIDKAQFNLSLCYSKGDGVEQNSGEAFKWCRLAAEQGYAKAQFNLGIYYANGEGTAENNKEAYKWYKLAAEQGHIKAQFNLALCYLKGDGVEQNSGEAFKWFKKSAEQGHIKAQFNLGICYDNGEGVKENKEEAFKWYKLAAEQGDAESQYNLGYCYYSGEGVEEDYNTALKWLKKAYDNGYTQCDDLIKEIEDLINKQNVDQLNIPENIDIFISWNHNNSKEKNKLKLFLENNKYQVWESDTSARGELTEAVKEGIRRAKGYIILLSYDAYSSNFIPKEIEMIFNTLKEKNITDKNIKIYVLKDDNHDVKDVINELNKQDNSFTKLIPLTVDFNYDENNEAGILKFTKTVVKEELFREYRNIQKKSYDVFPVTLSDVMNKQKDETIVTSLTFENGYINRDLVGVDKKYNVNDILNYKNNPILIYGAGGTGKSLYLKNLIRINLNNNKLFFYLPYSEIKTKIDKTNNLLDIIRKISFKEEKYYHIREDLSNILISDKLDFYIIIDALDEALDKTKSIVNMAIDFYKNNRKDNIHLIFSSRNLSDSKLIADNNIDSLNLKIRNMDDEDISKLFDNILERQKSKDKELDDNKHTISFNNKVSKEAFMQTLEILSDDIKKNPLLISNLIYIYFVTNKLYTQKYEIIDKSEELLITALENERTIGNDIFDTIHLSARQILTKLAYDLCDINTPDVEKLFKEYIKKPSDVVLNLSDEEMESLDKKNSSFSDIELNEYAKKLYNHLKARKIITGNSISHEIYRSYFAACYIYDMIYKQCLTKIKVKYIEFNDKEILTEIIDSFLSKNEKIWPIVSVDLICKLDFEMHYLKNKMDEKNPSYETFDESLKEMLKEDGISTEAYNGLYEVLNKKLLFFYEFILKHMNR